MVLCNKVICDSGNVTPDSFRDINFLCGRKTALKRIQYDDCNVFSDDQRNETLPKMHQNIKNNWRAIDRIEWQKV